MKNVLSKIEIEVLEELRVSILTRIAFPVLVDQTNEIIDVKLDCNNVLKVSTDTRIPEFKDPLLDIVEELNKEIETRKK